MSKSKHIIILSILCILLFSFALFISCEKNGTGGEITFEPQEYLGTYSIVKIENLNVVTLIDTMSFRFTAGGAVFIKLDTLLYTTQARDFCDVTGTYTVSGNRLEIMISTIYSQTCDPTEIPEDKYTFYGRSGEIVLDGLDDNDQDIDRQIILWLEEE